MKRKPNYLPFFLTFFILSLVLILLGSSGFFNTITSLVNKSSMPAKNFVYILSLRSLQNKEIKKLTQKNLELQKRLEDEYKFITDNIAYKSQFEKSEEKSSDLLPAGVIGYPGFVPGVTQPEFLMIDKGEGNQIELGDTVISDNYLVGKIVQTYPDYAKIELITNEGSSFTAKIGEGSEENGIIKGQGDGELLLDNVLLTSSLNKDTNVLTKGDKDEQGFGYPPDILVGKIVSIEKNQSDLFQRASIESPLDFKNLEIVFVLKD